MSLSQGIFGTGALLQNSAPLPVDFGIFDALNGLPVSAKAGAINVIQMKLTGMPDREEK